MSNEIINILTSYNFHKSLIERHRIVSLTILSIILILTTTSPIMAVPSITSFVSDTNGSSQYIQVNSGTVVTFTVTASGATSYNWYIDGWLNATHTSVFAMPMREYHSIAVTAQDGTGNSSKAWKTIITNQVTASATVPPFNESYYQNFENQLANPDLVAIIGSVPAPYTFWIGDVFYLLMWFLTFAMIWIRSGKLTVPTTLGFIIGSVIIAQLPAMYQPIGQLIIICGFVASLYLLARERK